MRTNRRRFLGLLAAVSAMSLTLATAVAEGSPPPSAVTASGATSPTGSTGATGPLQPLAASVSACHTDVSAAGRYAIFAAQMTAVPGTITMSVEFQLQERAADGHFADVPAAPGFGTWVTSRHGVGIFNYSHEVTQLPAPGTFRVNIHARWIAHRHRIIRTSVLVSPVCVQTLPTPDLAIGPIAHKSAGGGQVDWSVEVDNAGGVAAGAFQVTLAVGATALPPASVSGLAPGASVDVQFTGPRCASGAQLTAVADPSGAVDEPADSRRTKTLTCP